MSAESLKKELAIYSNSVQMAQPQNCDEEKSKSYRGLHKMTQFSKQSRDWLLNKWWRPQPFALSIVMLPLPPSVLILVLPMTGLPEKAEVPRFSGGGFGGAWIR
jgi:hypothetical protein